MVNDHWWHVGQARFNSFHHLVTRFQFVADYLLVEWIVIIFEVEEPGIPLLPPARISFDLGEARSCHGGGCCGDCYDHLLAVSCHDTCVFAAIADPIGWEQGDGCGLLSHSLYHLVWTWCFWLWKRVKIRTFGWNPDLEPHQLISGLMLLVQEMSAN